MKVSDIVLSADKNYRDYGANIVGDALDGLTGFDAVTPKLFEIFSKKMRNPADAAEFTVFYYTLAMWEQSKTVYRFNSAFFNALCETEGSSMHTELLKRLPHQAFYLSVPFGEIEGYFVYVEPQNNGDCLISTVAIAEKDKQIAFREFSLWIQDGQTIQEAAESMDQKTGEMFGDKESFTKARDGYQQPIKECLLAAYYLASQNAEIKPVKTKKESRTKRSNGTALNVRSWDVGYRVGQTFAQMYAEGEKETDIPAGYPSHEHKAMRPHVRRAHWHHYWTGKGRTELTLLWVAPTFINGTQADIIPIEHIKF